MTQKFNICQINKILRKELDIKAVQYTLFLRVKLFVFHVNIFFIKLMRNLNKNAL